MNDTPRTDAAEKHAYEFKDEYTPVCESKLVRKLERELNAANDRIKRLEEAGDALKAAGYFGGWADAVNKWIKAKEDEL